VWFLNNQCLLEFDFDQAVLVVVLLVLLGFQP
jgi:hypothetical protein